MNRWGDYYPNGYPGSKKLKQYKRKKMKKILIWTFIVCFGLVIAYFLFCIMIGVYLSFFS